MPAADRVVPFKDVFALDDTLEDVAVLVSTFVAEPAIDDEESAELDCTGVKAVVALLLVEASVETAEVDVAGSDEFAPPEGVSNALPVAGVVPAPAPEDDPAVFDPPPDEDEAPKADWM